MTTFNSTPNGLTIKSVQAIYTVADRRGDVPVVVEQSGAYACKCDAFALYGECKHTETVKAHRQQQDRKF